MYHSVSWGAESLQVEDHCDRSCSGHLTCVQDQVLWISTQKIPDSLPNWRMISLFPRVAPQHQAMYLCVSCITATILLLFPFYLSQVFHEVTKNGRRISVWWSHSLTGGGVSQRDTLNSNCPVCCAPLFRLWWWPLQEVNLQELFLPSPSQNQRNWELRE